MLNDFSKQQVRRRIDQIRKTLSQFGVSDPGEITDLFKQTPAPTVVALEKLLCSLQLKLPPNVKPRFIAESLLSAVNSADPLTLRWRETYGAAPNLAAIKAGAKQAGKYHRTIFSTLQGVFDGSLSNGRIEQEINTGIHRVDIMFDNFSKNGFFFEVRSRLSLKSEYVPIECKNYSDDIASPEYDQLGGRLNMKDRQVGLLVVRKIVDKKKSFEHVKAKWAKGELVIVFDDDDILNMHQARHAGRRNEIDKLIWAKVRKLRLNSDK